MTTIAEKLRELLGGKKAPSIDNLKAAVTELDVEAQAAGAELQRLTAARDDAVLSALTRGDSAELDAILSEVAVAERRTGELKAAAAAAAARVVAAEERQKSDSISQQWAFVRGLVDERNAVAGRLEGALDEAIDAIRVLREIEPQILANVPVRCRQMPDLWGAAGHERAIELYVAARVPPMFARSRGLLSVPELLALPGLADRFALSGAEALAADPVPPTTAAEAA